jgi:hypothetical protein
MIDDDPRHDGELHAFLANLSPALASKARDRWEEPGGPEALKFLVDRYRYSSGRNEEKLARLLDRDVEYIVHVDEKDFDPFDAATSRAIVCETFAEATAERERAEAREARRVEIEAGFARRQEVER